MENTYLSSIMTGTIDSKAGIIYGASLMTIGPAIGHGLMVDKKGLEQLLAACKAHGEEGVKFSLDHSGQVLSGVGVAKNFKIDGDHVRGDIHLFELPEKERILALAKNLPNSCGLSVETPGNHEAIPNSDQKLYRCSAIQAVSLVSIPAANSGLFTANKIDSVQKDIPKKTIMEQKDLDLALLTAFKPINDKLDLLSAKVKEQDEKLSKIKDDEDDDEDDEDETKLQAKITAAVLAATASIEAAVSTKLEAKFNADKAALIVDSISKFSANIGAKTVPTSVDNGTVTKLSTQPEAVTLFNAKVEELKKAGIKNAYSHAVMNFPELANNAAKASK